MYGVLAGNLAGEHVWDGHRIVVSTQDRGDQRMKIVSLADFQGFSSEKMRKHQVVATPRFFCDVYCFEPGQEQKSHIHADEDKLYFVLEGQGTFRVGDREQNLGPGQGTLAPAGEEHGVTNRSGSRLRVLVFMAPNPS